MEPLAGRDYVLWAYRLLLGREPESVETIENNPYKNDRRRLVEAMIFSKEFQNTNLITLPSQQQSGLGVEFDIRKLRHREKRWDNIAELRQWTKSVPVGNGLILCRTLGKYRQYVSESDIGLSPYMILDGFCEYSVTEFVARNVSAGMTVLDIGANYGYYTLLMADLVGSTGKVYAFEPNSAAANAIGFSLMVNGYYNRVSIDRRALWNHSNEQVTFHIPVAAATNGRIVWPLDSRLPASDAGTPNGGAVTIETVALDDLSLEGVALVKADIEGAEERLWQGAQKFFQRNPDVIFLLEFNCRRCENAEATLADIQRLFALRYLDEESTVRDVTVERVLEAPKDWILVLSQRELID